MSGSAPIGDDNGRSAISQSKGAGAGSPADSAAFGPNSSGVVATPSEAPTFTPVTKEDESEWAVQVQRIKEACPEFNSACLLAVLVPTRPDCATGCVYVLDNLTTVRSVSELQQHCQARAQPGQGQSLQHQQGGPSMAHTQRIAVSKVAGVKLHLQEHPQEQQPQTPTAQPVAKHPLQQTATPNRQHLQQQQRMKPVRAGVATTQHIAGAMQPRLQPVQHIGQGTKRLPHLGTPQHRSLVVPPGKGAIAARAVQPQPNQLSHDPTQYSTAARAGTGSAAANPSKDVQAGDDSWDKLVQAVRSKWPAFGTHHEERLEVIRMTQRQSGKNAGGLGANILCQQRCSKICSTPTVQRPVLLMRAETVVARCFSSAPPVICSRIRSTPIVQRALSMRIKIAVARCYHQVHHRYFAAKFASYPLCSGLRS